MQVTDESGNPVKELRYDSFGVLLEDSNPAFRLDIGFAGGVTDEDTGLVRFGSRDYDPVSGRWTAFDPIYYESGSANLYAYVDNNPVNFRDPCGQACIGFSFYSGWGGGLKVCIDTDGNTALCGEFGVGLGGGLDVSLTESVPEASYVAFEVGAKVKGGPFSIAGGYEWKREMDSPCIEGAPKLSVGFGPYEYDVMSPSESKRSWADRDDLKNTAGDVIDNAKKNLKDEGWSLKNNLEAAAKLKGCRSSIK
jgi:RHS repeat-associated protein